MPGSGFDPETLRLQASSFVAQMRSKVSIATIRPLPIFVGLREADDGDFTMSDDAYSPPLAGGNTWSKIQSRIKDNWKYFMSNYFLLATMTAIVVALMHPFMLIAVGAVFALWWCHDYLIKHELNFFGIPVHSLLTVQQRFYALFVISIFVIAWSCFMPAIVFFMISAVIILFHASLRDTTHLHEASERGKKTRLEMSSSAGGEIGTPSKDLEKDPLINKV